ncbi:MAG: hypothetical protein J5696_03430 [Lachnospiraceae bacterium]|nr:hypothetical protein [Lachnospiraceae bacterium]
MKIRKRLILSLMTIFMAAALFILPAASMPVRAAGFDMSYFTGTPATTDPAGNAEKQAAYNYLISYKNSLINQNNPSQDIKDRLEKVWADANAYIANSTLTCAALVSYVNMTVENFDSVIGDITNVGNTEEFLFVNNNSITPSGTYGQLTYYTLSLINLGKVDVTDVVITPQESTDINKWPFDILTASSVLVIPKIQASSDVNVAHTYAQDVTWAFRVSAQAKTGTYPLVFHVQYYRNGQLASTDITTYINITGAPGAGTLSEGAGKDENTSTPRIIVTGFRTDPEVVYAGDTFNLTVTLQNTSLTTAVSNIQFDFKAASEGNNNETTYEAFLPTSGSATKFVSVIPAGATTSISIEMTARSDLSQKPYVITLNAAYEDSERKPYTMSSNISIPVKQEARIDTGEVEILPNSIEVGNQTNVMFPVYNKGKTTLYNVQVDFIGDTVEGGSTFLGKLEPGATGNVDAMVTGIAPTMDDGIVIARVSYEDEAGNVTYIEKEITIWVMEAFDPDDGFYMDDGFYDGDFDDMDGEGGGGVNVKAIVIAIIIIAIVAVIIWRVIAKRRKKQRMLRELDDIDDDI